jgi:hypothetical protein
MTAHTKHASGRRKKKKKKKTILDADHYVTNPLIDAAESFLRSL